jgi:site-specific recombinase XerD
MRVEVGMHDLVTLGPWLRRFLCEHIVTERNLARNTRKSYRDTFSLLLPLVSRKLRKPVDRLAVRDLTSRHVLQFLAHLRKNAGAPPRPAISGLPPSGRSPASSAAGIRPMSNGAATSGPSHRRNPYRRRSDG